MAVTHALKLWRHYLLGCQFELITDHKSLKWIFTQPTLNMRQRRWVELLQEYDFLIIYQPGKENVVADSLSRKAFLNAISIPNNPIISRLKEVAENDPVYQQKLKEVLDGEQTLLDFTCNDGCLYFKGRLHVPKDSTLKRVIMFEAHDSPTAGHPGYAKTLNAVRKSYHWT